MAPSPSHLATHGGRRLQVEIEDAVEMEDGDGDGDGEESRREGAAERSRGDA